MEENQRLPHEPKKRSTGHHKPTCLIRKCKTKKGTWIPRKGNRKTRSLIKKLAEQLYKHKINNKIHKEVEDSFAKRSH